MATAIGADSGVAPDISAVDYWHGVEEQARALPHMPNFWAAGRHAGIFQRAVVREGYQLVAQSTGSFASYFVEFIPLFFVLGFAAGGLAAGFGTDMERPGGVLGGDDVFAAGYDASAAPWTIWHTILTAVMCGGLGYIVGLLQQMLTWYNAGWGDAIVLEETQDGTLTAVTMTKMHRLSFASRQGQGYYRGNAKQGHISKAKILLRCHPVGSGGERGEIPGGLAGATMDDLYNLLPGTGHSTEDPGKLYEAWVVRLEQVAERFRRREKSFLSRYKVETGFFVVAVVMIIAACLQMMQISSGQGFDVAVVGDGIQQSVGLGGGQ